MGCSAPREILVAAPTITHVWLDKGYTGTTVAEAAHCAGVSVDTVSGPKPLTAHEGFLILSQIALLLRRLDRSKLFDTL